MRYVGEVASLLASVGWAGSALFFEFGSKKIGSLYVNLWRLLWAFLLVLAVNLLFYPEFLRRVTTGDVVWLLLSGVVGFFVGDILLFWSFVIIGSRLSLLIMLLYPLVSALGAGLVFGERLSGIQWLAMLGTLLCVGGVVFSHHRGETLEKQRLRGILAAIGGMLGQAGGALLAKPALVANTFVFEATWIRIVGGLVAFFLVVVFSGRLRGWLASARQQDALLATVGGSVFGPFLGVSLFLLGMRYAPVGVATTLSSLSPVILMGRDMVKGKRVQVLEIVLTLGAVVFLYLFFA